MDKFLIVIGEFQKTAHIGHSCQSEPIHNAIDIFRICFNFILQNNMPQIGYSPLEKFAFTGFQCELCFC